MELARRLSVGEIAEQLLADHLIDACELRRDAVVIDQDGTRHIFSYDRARTFIMALMHGRSWMPLIAAEPRSLSSTLEELAATAQSMELIERYEFVDRGGVRIILSACEAEMPAEDAVAFLADCILQKIHSMQELPGGPTGDAAWSPDRPMQPALPGN